MVLNLMTAKCIWMVYRLYLTLIRQKNAWVKSQMSLACGTLSLSRGTPGFELSFLPLLMGKIPDVTGMWSFVAVHYL